MKFEDETILRPLKSKKNISIKSLQIKEFYERLKFKLLLKSKRLKYIQVLFLLSDKAQKIWDEFFDITSKNATLLEVNESFRLNKSFKVSESFEVNRNKRFQYSEHFEKSQLISTRFSDESYYQRPAKLSTTKREIIAKILSDFDEIKLQL